MARHFRNTFSWDRLYITSTYRSKWFQDFLVKQWCSLLKCAKVWTSEHQAGLALDLKVITRWGRWVSFDITDKPNKYYDRLKANAAKFGFHNTYQRGIEIDGKIAEWRHRRYVGEELATILMNNDQTFAEYYNSITK
jgi:LAS superfamily LD-carboxypeptidase LdcB